MADVLRRTSRATDTPARFGGDEFVIVLPETDEVGAIAMAHRVAVQVADDTAVPRLSVTTGVSEYPRDGATPTELMGTADGALYRSKARAAVRRRSAV